MKGYLRILAALAVTAIPALPSVAQTAQPQYVDAVVPVQTGVSGPSSTQPVVASNRRGTVLLTGAYAEHASGGTALIIPGKDTTGEQMAALAEDMQVMCRILDRNLAPTNLSARQVLYRQLLMTQYRDETLPSLTGPATATRSIYVDGYGLLFLLTVDYPLSAPAQEPKQEDLTDQTKDPLWQQVHDELYNPQHRSDSADETAPEYDPEMVARLTDNAIKSFTHAANIRGPGPDAFVTLIIRSYEADPTVKVTSRGSSSPAPFLPSTRTSRSSAGTQATPVTTLVLRTRKRDVDAFAAKETLYGVFRQKVELTQY